MTKTNDENYGIAKIADLQPVDAPDLPYQPQDPQSYRPRIGLIGCGGVTVHHLRVYKEAGYDVVTLCDIDSSKPRNGSRNFILRHRCTPARDLLNRADIEVVISPHQGTGGDYRNRPENRKACPQPETLCTGSGSGGG